MPYVKGATMQLKIQRSQRQTGVLSKTMLFCVDARAFLAAEEQANVQRYRLGGQVIYSSQAARKHAENAAQRRTTGSAYGEFARERAGELEVGRTGRLLADTMGHYAVGMIHGLAARLSLNITIDSIQRGQHIECKDLDEVLDAENALMEACKNLTGYLQTAATFDGREVLIDFSGDEPTILSQPIALAAPAMDPAPIVQPSTDDSSGPPPFVLSPAPAAGTDTYDHAVPPPNPLDGIACWWDRLGPANQKWALVGVFIIIVMLIIAFH